MEPEFLNKTKCSTCEYRGQKATPEPHVPCDDGSLQCLRCSGVHLCTVWTVIVGPLSNSEAHQRAHGYCPDGVCLQSCALWPWEVLTNAATDQTASSRRRTSQR